MSDQLIRSVEAPYLKEEIPDFSSGDTVRVHVRVREGEKERIQVYQGVVVGRKHGKHTTRASFRVRKMSSGVGVERVFPLHSPLVAKIEIVQRGLVRRSKLYYLRGLSGKAARIRERRQA
ncbi:MAG: 50S ribosomal protein L19 [Acidobacteria bacterium]|jgi:large subunit ribosomal protein L19|nr:50S ribosomal protein L19 [Acidobacteriota bacterium]